MMEDQSAPVANQTRQEILNIPFILLIVVIALLVPLAAAAPISLERAERPATPPVVVNPEDLPALGEMALDALYEDPGGITMNYPSGWVISPIQPGSFMLTNYPVPIQSDPLPLDFVGIQIDNRPLTEFTIMPDGTAPPAGTSVHEMAAILVELILGSPDAAAVTDLTVGDAPAARFPFISPNDPFGAGELILVTPDDATVTLIQTSTTPENEGNMMPLVDNILASIVFTAASGS